jgi:hypothetical protein
MNCGILKTPLLKSLSPKDTHGPIVPTGPTAGKVRSRNKNGQWRRKRSDAGKPRVKN